MAVLEGQGRFDVKERWMNLAPLRDLTVVEDEGGGLVSTRTPTHRLQQSHLVAASGASMTNSLRVIRSGVGLDEVLAVEGIHDVTGLFPLASGQSTGRLLISTDAATGQIGLDPEPTALPLHPDVASSRTIAASLVRPDVLAHVNARAVTLYSLTKSLNPVHDWRVGPDEEIVAASISDKYILVAKKGGTVAILTASGQALEELAYVDVSCRELTGRTVSVSSEVSTVAILSAANVPSPVIAISTWTSEILLYSLDHIQTTDPVVTPINEQYHAVSLMLRPSTTPVSSGVQLIAGMSDGSMVVYELEQSDQGGGVKNVSRKASSLGSRPLILCPVDSFHLGSENIIAIGLSERMSVVFESKGRIDFSAVSKKASVTVRGNG
jgi:DNA damage-binding protein 1